MTALPLSTAFTDSAVTEGEFKTAITNQRDFLAGLLGDDGNVTTALKTLGSLCNDTVAKSSAYTVVAADRGVVFICTGTFTLSLTASATLADGFSFVVINVGSGTITIEPSSTEQIDGANTKTIYPNQSIIVFCNGSTFYSLGSSSYSGLSLDVFTSNGTWSPPAGTTKAFVYVAGGGGAGGCAQYSGSRGGSGGNGGRANVYLTSLTGSYSITIGSGGTAVDGSNNSYNNSGQTSSFGTIITCTGGGGGQNKKDGATGINGANGTVSITSGTRLQLNSFPTPFVTGTTTAGDNGTGASLVGASVVLGTSGANGLVAIFY